MLSIGAAILKLCVSPLLLDQIKTHVPKVITLKTGERVIEDPETTSERVMLWFQILINVGGFMGTATSYSENYVGWWLTFLLPLILYFSLPILLWWLKLRMVIHPPGGSDLVNIFRVLGYCMRGGGLFSIGRAGWWNAAKPTALPAKDMSRPDETTNSSRIWNDNGITNSQNFQSTMLTSNGVPNDLLTNMNSLAIIVVGPMLNYGLYPLLRNRRIHYGPVAHITTGLLIASLAGMGYAILQARTYATNPCGSYGGSDPRCVEGGLVSPISLWWSIIPIVVGGASELVCNVPAYSIAYSHAPVNMRGLVSAINLLNISFGYAIKLALAGVVVDPNLTWSFGGVAIIGAVLAVIFYFIFRYIDKKEYVLSTNAPDLHNSMGTTHDLFVKNELNERTNKPAPIGVNEIYSLSQKQ